MKKSLLLVACLCSFAACNPKVGIDPEKPSYEQLEHVSLCATVPSEDGSSKVSFDYTTIGDQTGMFTRWEGNEQLDVYIKSQSGTYTYAGRIPAVENTLSADHFTLNFAGHVQSRPDPLNDVFVFVYTNGGASYDWTKQTLNMTESGAEEMSLKALKSYSPIVFAPDSQGNIVASNKACYIKFTASNLGSSVDVKSLSIYSSSEAVFPKTFDLTTFDYQSSNKSKTLSYAFENLKTDASGNLAVYLAAPIIPAGEKNLEIHVVTESADHTISTLGTTGITSTSAMSASKLYRLTRNSFTGKTNPAATVGQTQGGSTGASDVVIESIVGQWDKTGYLSNDIYGVLDLGKPENLDYSHNRVINSIYKIYNAYFSGNTDTKIHRGAVEVAGKAGVPERTDLPMAANGPQYVTSIDNTGTFNNIVLTKDTEVYMTFIDSKAWNTNTIGYYCYTGDTDARGVAYSSADGHKTVHDLIVFPSTSQSTQGEHLIHKFESKTTAQLLYPESDGVFKKVFPAGTTIGLMERVNALEQSADFALKAISNASPVHYSNIAWNKLNTLQFCDYWNQIAVLKLKMPEDADFNRHGLIYAMKDKYQAHGANNEAANWTNPIILVYTKEADAINYARSKDYWTHTVDMSSQTFDLSYNLESVTSSAGNAKISLTADKFTNNKYCTTLKVANSEFGTFSSLSVVSGGVDITNKTVTRTDDYTAEIVIDKSLIGGDVLITAHASRKVYVQSLTAEELNALGAATAAGDLPRFRLILHSTTASSGNVAFTIDTHGNSAVLPEAQSVLYKAKNDHIFRTATQIIVQDQYNDYEWSIESATDGFKLKKVTKYTDTDVRTDGFITRGPDYVAGYPYVRLSDAGTVLTAEAVSADGYQMRIKCADNRINTYNYMTCAIGWQLQSAIFNTGNQSHTNQYGTWMVYKVWIE